MRHKEIFYYNNCEFLAGIVLLSDYLLSVLLYLLGEKVTKLRRQGQNVNQKVVSCSFIEWGFQTWYYNPTKLCFPRQ